HQPEETDQNSAVHPWFTTGTWSTFQLKFTVTASLLNSSLSSIVTDTLYGLNKCALPAIVPEIVPFKEFITTPDGALTMEYLRAPSPPVAETTRLPFKTSPE